MNNKWYGTNKIVNDPVHGFITLEYNLLLDVMNHPWMQRLRRIRQLGMTNLVYPGAQHTRFQHSLGAMHLMHLAIEVLKNKGTFVTEEEQRAAMAAMMLHDIGHGPFSHVLENSIISNVSHEDISRILVERMNHMMAGRLSRTIDIFEGRCKPFLHQLVSSQLDTDRLDYLKRDCFFTGVTEGTIGSDRIIKMLDVSNDELVVEGKGIYSIEKFLMARRLMYWQVYLHKTVVAAERMLTLIMHRAKYLARTGDVPFAAPQLAYFLENDINDTNFDEYETVRNFTLLDDSDIMSSIKVWSMSNDKILATLSTWFINRHLFQIEESNERFDEEYINTIEKRVEAEYGIPRDDCHYFVTSGSVSSRTYSPGSGSIRVKFSDTDVREVTDVSELNLEFLGRNDVRWYLCYPRGMKRR